VGEDRTDRPGPNQQRATVAEAAVLLGISEGAVRMRVKRGTLPSTREGGRLYVLLNIDPTPEPERPHDGTHDRTSELIDTLREQLEAERQAHAEARRLLAAALERIPAIQAPPDERESPETAEEQQGRGEPHPATVGAQEGVQRPWWRRVFGG
jgi:excisionase family DNA binding protein